MTWWIFQNVVMTTILVAVVSAICRVGRIGPVARHALWVIVLLKFVTPPLVVWPWAAPDPLGIAGIGTMAHTRVDVAPLAVAPGILPESDGSVEADSASLSTAPPTREVVRIAWAAIMPWASGLWLAGSLCLVFVESVRLMRLRRQVRGGRPPDRVIADRVVRRASSMGVRPPDVVVVPGISSPVVWGLGRPVLLWPADLPEDLPELCLDGLIVHELAHLKRRDHFIGWVELLASVVWWWNPLFWIARAAVREQSELACDAWVISSLPHGRRAYAESLLALSIAPGGRPLSPLAAGVVGAGASHRRVLERRLVMIMKGHTPIRLPLAGLLTLVLVAAATLPAWATGQQPPPPPPPPQPVPVVARPTTPPAPPQAPPAPVAIAPGRVAPAPQKTTPPTPPKPAIAWTVQGGKLATRYVFVSGATLPAEGQELLKGFEADREAIQAEADKKIATRRDALVKALQDLQDQFAKSGKLDEAVAIRDYLRAGGPDRLGGPFKWVR